MDILFKAERIGEIRGLFLETLILEVGLPMIRKELFRVSSEDKTCVYKSLFCENSSLRFSVHLFLR